MRKSNHNNRRGWWWLMGLVVLTGLAFFVVGRPTGAQSEDPDVPTATNIPSLPVPPDRVISGVVPDLPPGYMVIEGDIQVTFAEFEQRYRGTTEPEPRGTYETNFWPLNFSFEPPIALVPYEFNDNVTVTNQALMQTAMQDWEDVSNVIFILCPSYSCDGDHVHIQDSTVNNSAVGRQGGEQIINIVNWNSRFIMAHELGHALGLRHEQSRLDRNSFVQINLGNVCKATDLPASCLGGACFDNMGNQIDCDFAFDIAAGSRTYGTYDFDSVMHYGRTAFSRNGSDTITVLPPNDTAWQNAIGQRTRLSFRDKNVMGCMYPRNNWSWVSTTAVGPFFSGSCHLPYDVFVSAYDYTPEGGRLWLEPGTYVGIDRYEKKMTWVAPNGPVTITVLTD